ncbi:short-chain Z-isoprenyl diphosphate synthase [Cryobacterium mesophilum]|uniref:Isoprenyl transferase n=1 Tax=Terrimesophilobacter mesophilus TaxID=433647 RepID=A0A4R8VB48_9MICO|nr:isoprenyl transferase [Terrimesophilobacter mesophilus]MBB5633774.1 short-chain Z-isoprenyl diphosphate synthase [Terrimesophilobacter mesophilus]TFB80454.1 isoprenyl transferase [Terrimesophilobacter mesophilus]
MRKREVPWARGILYGLYQKRLRRELAGLPVPRHIAMILDGSRRWARQNELDSAGHGHRAGAAKFREFLVWCDDFGVEVTTLYLLSTDNLSGRPESELHDLFEIIADLADELSHFRNWKVQQVGSSENLPKALSASLAAAEARTRSNTGMHINLAVGYGGRREIADAMRSIVRQHALEGKSLDALAEVLTPELIGKHLYTGGQPDPDLVIRTSGEQRLSDFMLWQSAHSEFYFVEALGPDLREVDLLRALRDYATRIRRFGQ